MHKPPRFIFTIDHLTDENMMFFGWVVTHELDGFRLYRREHDGEEVLVANDPPRWFMVDDPNDAQQMADGDILLGPDRSGHSTR